MFEICVLCVDWEGVPVVVRVLVGWLLGAFMIYMFGVTFGCVVRCAARGDARPLLQFVRTTRDQHNQQRTFPTEAKRNCKLQFYT